MPAEDSDIEADRLATQLAEGTTAVYAQAHRASNATALAYLNTGLAAERKEQYYLFITRDFAEGVEAFAGKRTPPFSGQ